MFHPHSFADPLGRLFSWNGDLYRAIRPHAQPYFEALLANPVVDGLMKQGRIIETERTNLSIEGYPLVVRQRQIPFLSYPHEWPVAMFRDACLLMIELCIELLAGGYTLKDGHPWNVVFDSCKAVFVDVTSVVLLKGQGVWPAYDEFYRFGLAPLLLMAGGQERIARALLPTYEGVTKQDLPLLTNVWRLSSSYAMWQLVSRLLGKKRPDELFQRLRSEISGIGVCPSTRPTVERVDPDVTTFMDNVLTELKAKSVLVLRSRELALTAARRKQQVVAFHLQPADATQLYAQARTEQLRILPLALDFTIPTPATGLSSHWLIAATDRLICDAALVPLGLVEELVFKRYLTFPQISYGIGEFCRQVAVVEFSHTDEYGPAPSWYTVEGLAAALNKYFAKVAISRLDPSNHALVICEESRFALE